MCKPVVHDIGKHNLDHFLKDDYRSGLEGVFGPLENLEDQEGNVVDLLRLGLHLDFRLPSQHQWFQDHLDRWTDLVSTELLEDIRKGLRAEPLQIPVPGMEQLVLEHPVELSEVLRDGLVEELQAEGNRGVDQLELCQIPDIDLRDQFRQYQLTEGPVNVLPGVPDQRREESDYDLGAFGYVDVGHDLPKNFREVVDQ